MKHTCIIKTGTYLAISLAASSLIAQGAMGTIIPESPAKGLYAKAEIGVGNNSDLKTSWDDGSLSNENTDEMAPVYKIVGGYQINPYVSAEGSYRNLGEYEMSATSDGSGDSWTAGNVSGTQEADGWALSVTGRWPISERWALVGTIGWFWWESEETYNENGFISGSKETGSDVTFSGGVEFDPGIKDRIVYTAELGHNRVGDDNLDVISGFAGILYRFP